MNKQKIKKIMDKNGIFPLHELSPSYPDELFSIIGSNAPQIIYCKGNLDLLNDTRKKVAIVGSRDTTDEVINTVKHIAKTASERDTIVVSGLARGIDAVSQMHAYDGGICIAVLPSSLDNIYPKENIELANKIIEAGGLLISMVEPGTAFTKQDFMKRNELIIALSDFVFVGDFKEKSGTMNAIKHSIATKKPIWFIKENLSGKELIFAKKHGELY